MMTHESEIKIRTRGRPRGAGAITVQRDVCLHEFAFMRAVIQGMEADKAAARYFPDSHVDMRSARARFRALVLQVELQLQGLGEAAFARSIRQALSKFAVAPCSLPSLEQFAEQFDEDMHSERELQELYQEEFGSHQGADPNRSQQLRSLSQLQSRGATVIPRGSDPACRWLHPKLAQALMGEGVQTLKDCCLFINRGGRGWYQSLSGLGQTRATRLVQWLLDHEAYLGVLLSQRVRAGFTALDTSHLLAPWPYPGSQWIDGGQQVRSVSLRSVGPNAMGAERDEEAITTWLDTLTLKSSNTQEAYTRDIERLLLWAHEQGKTLSSLTIDDALAHIRFLQSPPEHWMNPLPTSRQASDWRPMRGPLSQASTNRALAAIGQLYSFLVSTHYLLANPFANLGKVRGAVHQLDTLRSFSAEHKRAINVALQGMDESPSKRRLVAVLLLLETTGMRRSESHLTWSDIHCVPINDVQHPCFKVVGKGNAERFIPIKPSLLDALNAHRADRQLCIERGIYEESTRVPLISILERPFFSQGEGGVKDGALSISGQHRVLKSFFGKVATRCADPELRRTFESASSHWLRHTFAHAVLRSSDNNLPVTQQLLGHKSIATTGIYLKADLSSRLTAILGLQSGLESVGEVA